MTRHFVIYDADDQKSVMKDVCKTSVQMDTKAYTGKGACWAAISRAKDELIGPEQIEAGCSAETMNQREDRDEFIRSTRHSLKTE